MKSPAPRYRIALRLWVTLAVAMALTAVASTFAILYLQRPFIAARGGLAPGAYDVLFLTAIGAGALAALAGLALGVTWTRRVWAIIERTETVVPSFDSEPRRVRDELGALDVAVGRLTVSMDRLISDGAILGQLPSAILVVDSARRLVSFNTTAETLLGGPLAGFRGHPLLGVDGALPVVRGNEPLAEIMAQADGERGVLHVDEVKVTARSGRTMLFDITIQSQEARESNGAFVLLLRDATEKRRIREQIKRADQLAFLGEMAARLAHEVRTPLASLRGLVELLRLDLAEHDRNREYLERILNVVEHQEQLVDKLLSLTHPEPERWEPVQLADVLEGLIASWPGRRPALTVDRPLVPVSGDPMLLGQVFTNLVQNALEASDDGDVTVRVLMCGTDVHVEVTNEGSTIPHELYERIFQPFFTTKPKGTGLGLAIARQIVEAHRGAIRVESGATTSFVVELPGLPLAAAVSEHA